MFLELNPSYSREYAHPYIGQVFRIHRPAFKSVSALTSDLPELSVERAFCVTIDASSGSCVFRNEETGEHFYANIVNAVGPLPTMTADPG